MSIDVASEFLGPPAVYDLDPITIDRDTFFSQGNVWYSDEFWQKIGQHISKNVSLGLVSSVSCQTTKKCTYDTQIRKELCANHVFTPDEFAAAVARLIAKQPQGQKGALLNSGYSNLYYVKVDVRVLVANVFWHSISRRWSFGVWELDEDGGWDGGRFVFSRN